MGSKRERVVSSYHRGPYLEQALVKGNLCPLLKGGCEACLYLFCTCWKPVFRPANKQVLRGTEGKASIAAE